MRFAFAFALLFSGISAAASAQSRPSADPNWAASGLPGAAAAWMPTLPDPSARSSRGPSARVLFGGPDSARPDENEVVARFAALDALGPALQPLYGPDGAAPRVVFFDLRGLRAVAHVEANTPAGPATHYFELREVRGMWQVVGHAVEVQPRR